MYSVEDVQRICDMGAVDEDSGLPVCVYVPVPRHKRPSRCGAVLVHPGTTTFPHGVKRAPVVAYSFINTAKYMSVTTWLRTLLSSLTAAEAKEMLSGWRARQSHDGVLRDVMDGTTWHAFQDAYMPSEDDDPILLLDLSFDFLSPFFRDRFASTESKRAKVYFYCDFYNLAMITDRVSLSSQYHFYIQFNFLCL